MSARPVTYCEICGSFLELALDLGNSPPTCAMPRIGQRRSTEEYHPLKLLCCAACGHGQLSVVVDPKVMFPEDYAYQSGNSEALHEDFEEVATEAALASVLHPEDLVVDIGANDGTLLSKFPAEQRRVAVEPTAQIRSWDGPRYEEFFTLDLAKRIRAKHGAARVITATNVLAHVEHVHDVMRGIRFLLAPDGVFLAENGDLQGVEEGQWDTVYHEHIRFYSPHSFGLLLNKYGLGIRSVSVIGTHGGSFRVVASRDGAGEVPERPEFDWGALAKGASRTRRELREDLAREGEAWGVGATARATTVINFCGFDVEDIPVVCEVAGSDKIGRFIPGTRIPVVDEQLLFDEQPKRVILFSWHLAASIVPKLRAKGFEGDVIVPLPTPWYV